jgi:predicted dithiol-disulfide oxidoreductase (DUF899 family)
MSLVVYEFMYGKRQTEPCEMCTMWIDSPGCVAIASRRASTSSSSPQDLRLRTRWPRWTCRLPGGSSSFKYDLDSEDAEGTQDSTVSVFTRDSDGFVRHFYSAHPRMSDDIAERGIDLLSPVWHVLDLTPQGRGDWYPELAYG